VPSWTGFELVESLLSDHLAAELPQIHHPWQKDIASGGGWNSMGMEVNDP
jgi:hypothetical protein